MAKQPTIQAINVLLAYAALQGSDQELFNRTLNEFTFASPLCKREFIEQWRREVASGDTTLIVSMHDCPSER